MPMKIRGIEFEDNLDNPMGLEFYNLSHRFGFQSPNWPYFEDVKIERIHYMAKSGVLSQRITTPCITPRILTRPPTSSRTPPSSTRFRCRTSSGRASSSQSRRRCGSRSLTTISRKLPGRSYDPATS